MGDKHDGFMNAIDALGGNGVWGKLGDAEAEIEAPGGDFPMSLFKIMGEKEKAMQEATVLDVEEYEKMLLAGWKRTEAEASGVIGAIAVKPMGKGAGPVEVKPSTPSAPPSAPSPPSVSET